MARKIEPLHGLSAIITEKLPKKLSSRREWYSEGSDSGHRQRDSSGHSSSRTGSNVASLGEKKISKKGPLKDFFDESPKKKSKHLQTAPSYSFSTDGRNILLWIRYGAYVVFYDIDSDECEKYAANDVSLAAAGAKLYAVISSNENVFRL